MNNEILECQIELCDFAETLKDIAPVMHSNPRIIHQERNLDMAWYGEKNYFYFMYSSLDLVPGNFFDWSKQPHIKVNIEFDDMWVNITIHAEYTEDRFIPLTRYIEESGLELIIPETPEAVEEEEDLTVGGGLVVVGGPKKKFVPTPKIKYFEVSGLNLYNMDDVKQFLMEVDNQLHLFIIDAEV